MNKDTLKELKNAFRKYRFDNATHLGLGDVRLTLGAQAEFLDKVKKALQQKDEELAKKIEEAFVIFTRPPCPVKRFFAVDKRGNWYNLQEINPRDIL